MKREDFTHQSDHTGYRVFYKGKPLGGAGTLPPAKRKHWRHKKADAKMHHETAEREIQHILDGHGQTRFLDVIKKINSEEVRP